MPELDGFELAEIIRQHPRFQKTAIIFVSAVHLTDLDRLKGYESGAVDYVSVPVIPEILRAKVSVFTELYRKTRESERLNRELEAAGGRAHRGAGSIDGQADRAGRASCGRPIGARTSSWPCSRTNCAIRWRRCATRSASCAQKPTADPDVVWCRDVIERQCDQLTRLVDDLLDVSRITQGKIKLRSEPRRPRSVSSARPSRPAGRSSTPSAMSSWSSCRRTPMPDRRRPARLTQVIANLLNNAAKYQNPRGRIELSVRA